MSEKYLLLKHQQQDGHTVLF